MKFNKFNIAIGLAAFVGLVLILGTNENKVNWFASYASHHKIPYGTFVFKELLQQKVDALNFREISIPPFEFLKKDSLATGTYLFINTDIPLGEDEANVLLDWVSKGNTLFIGAQRISKTITDTLGIKEKLVVDSENFFNEHAYNLYFPELKSDSLFWFDQYKDNYFFTEVDSGVVALGYTDFRKDTDSLITDRPNFIKANFGKGNILMLTAPEVFTNYFILKNSNKNYTAGVISYIDFTKPLLLDAYYKNGKIQYASPLYVFLENEKLRWAYYLILGLLLVFIVFEGKRKQRWVAIVQPLQNQTVSFIHTITYNFFNQKNNTEIARLKTKHFMYFLREKLLLEKPIQDPQFASQLAEKTSMPTTLADKLYRLLIDVEDKKSITETQLKELDKLIDTVKKTHHGTRKSSI
ncbi:MAG: DUF4350 domain-containing protein [Bacteroidetes bacterium]|nr:DUF4350 domain-containing protein [Bacteroidota bacterium]